MGNLQDDQCGDERSYATGGKDGVFTFTVHGQACYALHEIASPACSTPEGTLPVGGVSA